MKQKENLPADVQRKTESTLAAETRYRSQRTKQNKQKCWGLSLSVSQRRRNKNMLMFCGQALSVKIPRTAPEGR